VPLCMALDKEKRFFFEKFFAKWLLPQHSTKLGNWLKLASFF
jgi:hypothetical protein